MKPKNITMYMKKNIFQYILYFISFKCVNSENILYLVALPSPSHHIWNREIINSLALQGHNVTVLAPDFDSIPAENVHYLAVNAIYKSDKMFNYKIIAFDTKANTNLYTMAADMFHSVTLTCKGIHLVFSK